MTEAAAFVKPGLILGLTIALALTRPQLASLRIGIAGAGLLGAGLTLATGAVSPTIALHTLERLVEPLVTIVALMTITLSAAQVGLLDRLAYGVARAANGDARRLFSLVFWSGAAVGALFTNDAAILLFTPMVLIMMDRISLPDWGLRQRLPYYFAVLYVGNLVGAFVISNPINIVAASFFDIDFVQYSAWMLLPALASMGVSWAGLRWVFRRDLPQHCAVLDVSERPIPKDPPLFWGTAAILGITLVGFMTERVTGLSTWMVASLAALALLMLLATRGHRLMPIIGRVDWHVLIFVCGIIIVTVGLRNAGLAHLMGGWIGVLGGETMAGMLFATSTLSAVSSAFINNHSTVGIMIWVIQDFELGSLQQELMVYAALIGGDLGPKMLPIGSLAALMWFRMLHVHGVHVAVLRYIAIGIPITMVAVLLSTAILVFQWWLVRGVLS